MSNYYLDSYPQNLKKYRSDMGKGKNDLYLYR